TPQAHRLFGPDEAQQLLDNVQQRHSHLVETLTPQPLTLAALTRLFKALLADGIPLAHPLPVLSAIAEATQQSTDHATMIDLIRRQLGTLLTGQICGPDETLPVITLSGALEQAILASAPDPVSASLIIEPDLARLIGDNIAAVLAGRPAGALTPALIVQGPSRRPLAELVRLRAPGCVVLSIHELPSGQPIHVLAVIGEAPADEAIEDTGSATPRTVSPKEALPV
ncbi:MAG: FHIPEP family type III secretion protein, partial [Vibrio fluvialis]